MIQASFSISVNLLTVKFTDTSSGEDGCEAKTWSWDFGDPLDPVPDPDTNLSSLQNPTHIFSAPGRYTVTLTVTDQFDNTSTVVRYIMVDTKPILPVSIEDLVKLKLPKNFPYQPEQIAASLATWQLYIQPLVNSPGVSEADTFNELAYPAIVNALIAYLVTYQIMSDYISGSAMSSIGSGMDGEAGGLVKKIETGPSNAEFMDTSDYLKFLTGENGLMSQIRSQMCMLAFRAMINIPYCTPLPTPKFIPLKAGRIRPYFSMWGLTFSDIIQTY